MILHIFIYIYINGIYYEGWSDKRWFPAQLYDNTPKLIKHFENNSTSRFKQLNDCIVKIVPL